MLTGLDDGVEMSNNEMAPFDLPGTKNPPAMTANWFILEGKFPGETSWHSFGQVTSCVNVTALPACPKEKKN